MKRRYKSKKLIIMSMFVAIGIVLQYIESKVLISPVPGGKLGLCNIVSVINIFMFGGKNAIMISLIRAFIGTFLTGGAMALPYSMAGAFFSTAVMAVIKKYLYPNVSMIGISITGAAVHNVMQTCVAAVMLTSGYIFSYLPFLLVVATISGAVTGYAAQIFGNRILKHGDTL